MTRQDAARKVQALKAITVERGATRSEAETARRLAAKLTKTYNLHHPASTPPPNPSPPGVTPADAERIRQAFQHMHRHPHHADQAFRKIAAGWFNPITGEHSDNVKVHRYQGRGNWSIEIF